MVLRTANMRILNSLFGFGMDVSLNKGQKDPPENTTIGGDEEPVPPGEPTPYPQ